MIKLEANTDKEWALATMFEGMSDEELEVELDIVNEELLEAFSRFIDVAIDDNCDDYLNEQDGFENNDGKWKCTKCGHVNIISKEKLEGII